jgi:hypothetical protein
MTTSVEPVSVRLVLRKTPAECAKTLVKNALAQRGMSIHGWRDIVAVRPKPDLSRLGDSEIRDVRVYANRTLTDYASQLRPKSADEMRETCEWVPTPLVDEILRDDTVHRRVVNVGAAYVKAERELCRKFPDIVWDMIDFPENLAAENADVAEPNMEFRSCYPLEFLETAERRYDVALFNRVLAVLTNAELRSYLRVLADCARFVVFCEPASTLRFVRSIDVDAIDPRRSLAMRGTLFIHNHRGIFVEHGFTLSRYSTFRTPVSWHGEQHYLIRGVARNTRFA